MKSQDILLLLKLVSLATSGRGHARVQPEKWQDWEVSPLARRSDPLEILEWDDRSESHLQERPSIFAEAERQGTERHDSPGDYGTSEPESENLSNTTEYSVRGLAASTGISKSQVSLSLQRCFDVGLAKIDRKEGVPRANTRALGELIIYGLRYVFPVQLGELTRGIATSLGAPVLEGQIMTAGELVPVWPDARGNTKGQAVTPLAPSVPKAVRTDPRLYALLALTDAIRIGQPRERNFAADRLIAMLKDAA